MPESSGLAILVPSSASNLDADHKSTFMGP